MGCAVGVGSHRPHVIGPGKCHAIDPCSLAEARRGNYAPLGTVPMHSNDVVLDYVVANGPNVVRGTSSHTTQLAIVNVRLGQQGLAPTRAVPVQNESLLGSVVVCPYSPDVVRANSR